MARDSNFSDDLPTLRTQEIESIFKEVVRNRDRHYVNTRNRNIVLSLPMPADVASPEVDARMTRELAAITCAGHDLMPTHAKRIILGSVWEEGKDGRLEGRLTNLPNSNEFLPQLIDHMEAMSQDRGELMRVAQKVEAMLGKSQLRIDGKDAKEQMARY